MVEEKKIPDGYKDTEVGIIPNDWDVINLGESSLIKSRIGWQGLTVKEYRKNGDYYLITGTDFLNNKINWNKCCFIDKKRYEQDRNIQIRNDDLLITKDGTIGKIAYVDRLNKPATLNSGIFLVRPKEHIYESVFLYHILRSFYFIKFLNQLSAGSTINHLYQKDIIKYNFILPKKEEQQAIATVLSDTDNLILSLEKLIDKKKLIKQGTMQELLTGKKRLDGFNDEWGKKKLGDIAIINMGQSPSSSNYNVINVGLPLIQGNADIQEQKTIARIFTSQITKKAECGDIIMTVRAPVGNIAKAEFECCLGRGVCSIKYRNNYLYHYLIFVENLWNNLSKGSTFESVNSDEVKSMNILIPSDIKEQEAIANILSDMDKEIETLQKKLDKYKKIKEGMMEELLTGKRRLI